MRLEEIGRGGAEELRDAQREAELARAAAEVEVAPARQAARALLGVVAHAELDLMALTLGERDLHVDDLAAGVVLDQAHAAEDAQRVQVLARLVEQALPEGLAGRERDLAPHDAGVDLVETGDRHGAEDRRRPRRDVVAHRGGVVAHVHARFLLDQDARVAALAKPGAQDRPAAFVALLVEGIAGLERDVGAQALLVLGRQGEPVDDELDLAHHHRQPLVDGDGDIDQVALRADHRVVGHHRVIEATAAVERTHALEIGAKRVGIEGGTLLPKREPAPRPAHECRAQGAAADLALPSKRTDPRRSGTLRRERLDGHCTRDRRGEQQRRERQPHHP